MRSTIALVACVWAATVSAGVAVPGPPFPNVGPPLLLRLEGVLERTSAAARGHGFTVVSLGFLGTEADERRWLGVSDARTVGGDQPADGKDVLNAVAPFTPNLLVAGPRAITDQLRSLPSGTRVVMEGLVDRGARTYYLRNVELPATGP